MLLFHAITEPTDNAHKALILFNVQYYIIALRSKNQEIKGDTHKDPSTLSTIAVERG